MNKRQVYLVDSLKKKLNQQEELQEYRPLKQELDLTSAQPVKIKVNIDGIEQ